MNTTVNRRITLAARPVGEPKDSDFELVEEAVPELTEDAMLLRTIYLSLDPYMRGRMNAVASYAPYVELGETMVGGTVSEVIASNLAAYSVGDIVCGYSGWQEYALSDGKGVYKVDPNDVPISTALGVLGMPGLTAYVGLLDIGQAKSGDTVVVSAASGAVGAVVGQIARIKGCKVVGVAGAEEKCRYVTEELGFDACVNHRAGDLQERLGEVCSDGIDIYYESVGGKVFEAAFELLNNGARVPVCGLISYYNATQPPAGPNLLPQIMRAVLTKRLSIRGFIVFDHHDRRDDFVRDMSAWIKTGSVKYREDIVQGLENAPRAFQGLLAGRNFGKLVVRVSHDPTAR